MFMGEYDHTADAKGRLFVPSKFRDELGKKFVVTKGLDGCLFAYGEEEWGCVVEGIRNLSLTDENGLKFTRFFFAGAAEVEADGQGRILLPGKLREYAGITKDVVSIGVGNRVEIWSKERYGGMETSYEEMGDVMKALSNMGIRL